MHSKIKMTILLYAFQTRSDTLANAEASDKASLVGMGLGSNSNSRSLSSPYHCQED